MNNYSFLMADTIRRRFPDPDSFPYRSWTYPQGFMLWGFIRLFEKTGDAAFRDYVLSFCEHHVTPDGLIPAFTGESLDDMMTGSVLVWAFSHTNEEKYRLACQHIRRSFDDYPRNPDNGFWHGRHLPGEMWIDGLFMGLMFLTRYGAVFGDEEYCYNETIQQLTVAFERCEKDGSGLLYHAYCENRQISWAHPITGKSSEIWCEGLGWYAMILPEVLSLIPKSWPGRDKLEYQLLKLIDGLERVQDPSSGLWLQVVDKPGYPRNWHDSSGSAMFTWTIKKAELLTHAGLLDRIHPEKCHKIAQKAFHGLKTKCIPDMEGNANIYDACDGLCVQDHYDIYVDYLRNVNSKEAVAAFFWASIIMEYGK